MAGSARAGDYTGTVRETADPYHRTTTGDGGRRRRGMVPGESDALPASRAERGTAGRAAFLPRESVLGRRARRRRMDRELDRIRVVGMAQRAQRNQAMAEEPQD